MANTLTNLAPDLYAALDTVSRELTGMIPAVQINADGIQRAAVGEKVRIPVTGAANVGDITPGMTSPEPTNQTVNNVEVEITKSRAAEFGFVGEEQLGLNNGVGYGKIQVDMIAQGMRALVNEVESDLTSQYIKTSRAYGTVGTIPFTSGLGELAQMHKILVDNGSPTTDKQMVLNTVAGASLRSNTGLTNVNNAGSTDTLREGIFGRLTGFAVRESGQFIDHTAGTGASATSDATGYAVGSTSITLAAVGTGTILAGDVITFAGDDNKYVVETGAGAVSGATIVIAAPGLQKALPTSATALTVTADYSVNMAFDRGAVQLVTRAPALPQEGDMAIDRMTVTDALSGLSFEVSVYPGYRKVRYEIALAWGYKVSKPEHTALLIG